MLAYLFSGQGSQYVGMRRHLFDEDRQFAAAKSDIDGCLEYSIRTLCASGPDNQLSLTLYTQPSTFVVNALHYHKARGQSMIPGCVAGHSL